jgi:hypothetical protein
VHASVTQYPTDEWTAQQLWEATPWRKEPKYLVNVSFLIEIEAIGKLP